MLSVNIVIIAVTVLISFSAFNNEELQSKLYFSPYLVTKRGEWWRIIGHAFVHADYLHLFFNMYVLYNFGGYIEDFLVGVYGRILGELYYIGLYFGGILFATLPALRKHSDNPMYRSVGASGAVSAVLFAFILLYPKVPLMLLFIPIPIPAYIFGALYLAFESYSNKKGRTNIAHDAHIAGAIFGIVYFMGIDFHYLTGFFQKIMF